MRRFPAGMWFERGEDGGWELFPEGENSQPLAQLRVGLRSTRLRIVASGPSLRDYAGWGEDRVTLAVNGAAAWMEEEGKTPDFLVVSDRRFAREKGELIARGLSRGGHLLATPQVLATLKASGQPLPPAFSLFEIVNEWYGAPALSREGVRALGMVLPESGQLSRVGWSDDPERGLFSGATVAYPALQLAVWMGGRDIEFAGLDLGGSQRVYEEKEAQPSQLDVHFERFIRPAFELAKSVLAERPIRLHNPSPVCPIDLNLAPDAGQQTPR
ncbi:hypothetical protein [Roseibacillus ishigakijimensis]|uniref:Uncharacterized protein n=1 Tax=Roseibacillus ishigakijimensis TaxID=454146 RepID=A0A934VM23_9BACT|nr:hypothetical protein [Roseibacillus ishigakijimensis]MBK1833671.1 hypothetical protein [Roseibacillus ishigakijimensis]